MGWVGFIPIDRLHFKMSATAGGTVALILPRRHALFQTRATAVCNYDGRRVVIPNANPFNQSVTVNTAFDHRRDHYDIGIGIGYGDDIEATRAMMLEVPVNHHSGRDGRAGFCQSDVESKSLGATPERLTANG